MTKHEFIVELKAIIETDRDISEDTKLNSLEEWDSLSYMSVMSYLDEEFSVSNSSEDYGKYQTVADLVELIKDKLD